MKKYVVLAVCATAVVRLSAVTTPPSTSAPAVGQWDGYDVGTVIFEDKAPHTRGSEIYHGAVADPENYIVEKAREVLAILYLSPTDSVPEIDTIRYELDDRDGISAKGGWRRNVNIFYSTRFIENSLGGGSVDTEKVRFETRGILLHELTHVYQRSPRGVGRYDNNRVHFAFIEGMADAVRIAGGGFSGPEARPKGGNYLDGYRTTGYFIVWIRDNKDPEFIRKFNRSTMEVIPWSFDGAVKHILGQEYDIDSLWHEYQVAVGDIIEADLTIKNFGEE